MERRNLIREIIYQIGKDFDFSGNTARFSTGFSEEEAFFAKRKIHQEDHGKFLLYRFPSLHTSNSYKSLFFSTGNQGGFRNPWAATPVRPSSMTAGSSGGLRSSFGEASPMGASSKSIWGNFGNSGLSPAGTDTSPGGGGGGGGLSPFSTANRQVMRPQSGQFNMSPSTSANYQQQQRRPVTLEDIEADMQRQQQQQANRYSQPGQPPNHGKTLSLAELEAALARPPMMQQAQGQHQPSQQFVNMMQQVQPQPQVQQPQQQAQQLDPMQLLALKQQQELKEQQLSIQREMKRRELYRKSQYDGLMTQHDKDLINRIQLSQLASGDPYADDFYYQVYSSLRQRAGLQLPPSSTNQAQPNNNAGAFSGAIAGTEGERGERNERRERGGDRRGRRGGEENAMQRMQQQLQRIVNDAKRRPKQTQVSLEGALGKITSLTVRNPRQVLQVPSAAVASNSSSSSEANTPTTNDDVASSEQPVHHHHHHLQYVKDDKRLVLKMTEDMYTLVLEIEQMHRQGPPQPRRTHSNNNNEEGESEAQESEKDRTEAFNEKYAAKVDKLYKALRLNEQVEVPFLISLLSITKGKKLIPRIVRQLNHDQNLTLLTVFASNFSKLQVCRHVIYPGTTVAQVDEARQQSFVTFDDVELFMNNTVPPLLGFIAEAPLRIVNGLLQLLLEKNDIFTVAQSKPGLAFLTMLLSRAEILKQGGGALQGFGPPNMEEVNYWRELYLRLFNSLKGRYLVIFPSLYYLVPLNPNTPMMQLSLAVDDMYVWQFLAAMAVGASMDQQHILVTEVR